MKKILGIVFILLFQTVIFASDIGSSIEQQYEIAKKAYKNKKFNESYEILSKLYLTRLSDKELNFYLGRSAYETGHYEIALAAYERVQMMDSGNIRNKLEMARTYFMLKMYEDSEALFKDILKNPNLPENVRRNVELYVAKVTGAQKKSFTYATINVDWMYDSNVGYSHDGNVGAFPFSSVSDQALEISADVVNLYDIGEKNGFAIRNKLSFYMKDYQEESDFDVQYIGYTPSLVYSEAKYLAEFAVGFDLLTLGGDDYLHTFSLMPRFEYAHTTTLRSIAYFKFMKKYFQQSAFKSLDANHYELSYGLQKILSPRSYGQVNLIALTESDDGTTPAVDIVNYDEYKINAVYANQFTATYSGEIYAEYLDRSYDNFDRDDDGGTISATFNAKIMWDMRLHIKAMYNEISSSQDIYSYKKHTFTAGINKTF